MKQRIIFIITLFLFTIFYFAFMPTSQAQQKDFANLAKYDAANSNLSAPAADENRVVFIGNSITEGWYKQDPDFFKENNFIGRGISGQTSPQLLLRFRQDVVDLQPAAVVIHIGTNDIAENTGPYNQAFTLDNIHSMVEIATANNIKVILASVLPATGFGWRTALGDPSDKILALNKEIKALAAEHNVSYADYHSSMKDEANGLDQEMATDGVHPTPLGYAVMKEIILPCYTGDAQ